MELSQNNIMEGFTGNQLENCLTITGGTMGKGEVQIAEVPINKIKLARNSRLNVNEDELVGLMQSIKETGLLQPIGVTKAKGGTYEICYGNRRFLAVSKLGKTKIPAIIHTHKSALEDDLKNLTENIQRRNISLVEAGRYMEILKSQNLSPAEIAVRLGVTKTYVSDCLKAYSEVPQQFRKDIEVRTVNDKKRTPGKISMNSVRAILSAGRTKGVSAEHVEKLFELAKTSERFEPKNAKKYAAALVSGAKNPIKEVSHLKRVAVQFWVEEDYYDTLFEKHVTKGPFKSLNGFFIAVLKGEKSGPLKIKG